MAKKADLIFIGGDIITIDNSNPLAEALAVKDGRILAVGGQDQVLQHNGPETEIIQLDGHTLMPGLIEPHSHPILSALFYEWIDVSGFNNPDSDAIIEKLRQAASEKKPGEWIIAFGYDPILTRGLKTLTAAFLSEISSTIPIFIMTQTMHTCYVNHKAFELAGITKDTPQPGQGSVIVKDNNGDLTGMLIEAAATIPFFLAMPENSIEENLYLVKNQLKRYALAGYTTIGSAGFFPMFPDALRLVKETVEHPTSPVRMAVYRKREEMENGISLEPGSGTDRYRYIGVKFWYDGSPYTGTMLLDEPYLNSDLMQASLGLPKDIYGHNVLTKQELREHVQKYHDAGWQISVHAQGDRAIRETIDVFDEILNTSPRSDHRHRIEHCALFPKDQFERAASLGLTPSWHINHIYYYGEALRDEIIGPERANRLMPIGSARDSGLRSSFHNDSPMYPAEPFKLLRTAVTRKTRMGDLIGTDQAVSVDDGLKALTIDAAWQMFMEDRVGSLETGKHADLAVLSENPLKINPERLDQIRVMKTYIEGKPTGSGASAGS
jgi:predicted amidohydrolase YtcJ